ncbi:uncharacterized protein C8R40DRAFT_1174446 [Lentinula edodes]|uniref:uncharacterized protein n=1 Tax=Lentinula edodes TaxID=5353 RepID=UPI001E8E320B|nr:uncharacterized protein C8R40DRAFT_1174446 [Lentinula edodes]KAH7871656.1 hypothetical protein C8R40DRAFT_1174446 [Lentinula edodes]
MQLLSPSTKLFSFWIGVLFLVPTMAVPTGSPTNAGTSLSMSGGLSASNPDLPGHSTSVDRNAYDQVLHAKDANTGQNPIIEARLWIDPHIFDADLHYRTAMGFAVEHMMKPIRSTILKDIKTNVKPNIPSLEFPSTTPVAVYRLTGKDFANQGDFEISFSGVTRRDRTRFRNWWFAMPGSLDPSYFGRVDLKCLVPTQKGSYVVKKELVTGKISRRYPEQNEEVLISFKDGKPLFKNGEAVSEESPKKSAPEETQKKSSLSRVKTLFGKKPGGPSSS